MYAYYGNTTIILTCNNYNIVWMIACMTIATIGYYAHVFLYALWWECAIPHPAVGGRGDRGSVEMTSSQTGTCDTQLSQAETVEPVEGSHRG